MIIILNLINDSKVNEISKVLANKREKFLNFENHYFNKTKFQFFFSYKKKNEFR